MIMIRILAVFLLPSLTVSMALEISALEQLNMDKPAETDTSNDPAAPPESVEEKKPLIDMLNAPVAPPESVEARMALRQHREATALNRFIFQGNVLEGTGDLVDHWIVMFCPSWHDKCQGLLPSFELLGVQWENKLNKDVMSSSVRFAKVDCATEKGLCVSLDVDDYPSVVHYRNQQRVASWHGGAPGLVRFVKQEIEGPKQKRRPKAAAKPKVESSCAADGAAATETLAEAEGGLSVLLQWMQFAATSWRTLCFVLALLAGARAAMLLIPRRAAPEKRCAGEKRHAVPSSRLQACLPREWARERRSIEL